MDVTVTVTTTARVSAPYDPDFPARARKIGGAWTGSMWEFDPRSEDAVRQLCRDIYGTDGSDNDQPRVTVRIPLDGVRGADFRPAGEALVRRTAFDKPVQYARHVVLVAGDFPHSGGSARDPELCPAPGTVIEVRDLAPGAAQRILDNHQDATVVEHPQTNRNTRIAALWEERARLTQRLAELDQALTELGAGPAT
jgi:hypothetical protein